MISVRLLSRIEQNWEKIATSVIHQSRRDQHIPHYAGLEEGELRQRALDIVRSLNGWMNQQLSEHELRRRYLDLGVRRRNEGFPLEELVYKLQTIEWQIVQYVQDDFPPQNAVDLHSELEVLQALHRFFGIVIHSVVTGYQAGTAHPAAGPQSARQVQAGRA